MNLEIDKIEQSLVDGENICKESGDLTGAEIYRTVIDMSNEERLDKFNWLRQKRDKSGGSLQEADDDLFLNILNGLKMLGALSENLSK